MYERYYLQALEKRVKEENNIMRLSVGTGGNSIEEFLTIIPDLLF